MCNTNLFLHSSIKWSLVQTKTPYKVSQSIYLHLSCTCYSTQQQWEETWTLISSQPALTLAHFRGGDPMRTHIQDEKTPHLFTWMTYLLLWCVSLPRATSQMCPGCCDRPPWKHRGCGAPGSRWCAWLVGCSRSGCGSSYLGLLWRTLLNAWPRTFR